MKLRIIPTLLLLVTVSTISYVSPTAQEPGLDEQPQAILDQLSNGVTIAIGSAGRSPMNMRGYLKNDGSRFTVVKNYEDTPSFKYTIVRIGNSLGIKSTVSGNFLRSSKNMGYALTFDAADMSSPDTQFVVWVPSKTQTALAPIWLYNRGTQGFISVRNRPDEVVTYDHTKTGAQHSQWEELFIEIKTPAPAPVPVEVSGPTDADLQDAHKEAKQLKEQLNGLRKEVERLNALLAQETKKKSISDEEINKIKACELEKAELMKKVMTAEAAREELFTMLMQAVEQLRGLMDRVKQGETLTAQAVMAAAPLAATPVGSIPVTGALGQPVTAKQAVKKSPTKKKTAKKKKGAQKKPAKKKKAAKKGAQKGIVKKKAVKKGAKKLVKKGSKKSSAKKRRAKNKSAKKAVKKA